MGAMNIFAPRQLVSKTLNDKLRHLLCFPQVSRMRYPTAEAEPFSDTAESRLQRVRKMKDLHASLWSNKSEDVGLTSQMCDGFQSCLPCLTLDAL